MRSARCLNRSLALTLTALLLLLGKTAGGADTGSDQTALAVDALTRLQGVDLASNARLKQAVLKLLARTRGTANFVRLVQHFALNDQNPGLLEVAQAQPASQTGVDAIRLLLAGDGAGLIETALRSTNTMEAVRTVQALGAAGDRQTTRLLAPLLADPKLDGTVRKQAVRALAKTSAGARELLTLARDHKLPDDLKLTAGAELNQAQWPEIKREAAQILPPARSQNAHPLPPIAELLAMKGNVANGARVFTNAVPGCANCHQARGQGVDFGPNLSEIGTKLGKDAILDAILDPSAGISFGFESFNLTLKSGDEISGFVVGETPEEVTLKTPGAILTRLKKSGILSRQASKLSVMPADLQASMTTQDLVDLVEYLSSLKKP